MITRKATMVDLARAAEIIDQQFVVDFMRTQKLQPERTQAWVVIDNKKVVSAVFCLLNPSNGIDVVQFYTERVELLDYVFKKVQDYWPDADGIAMLAAHDLSDSLRNLGFDPTQTTYFKPLKAFSVRETEAVQPITEKAGA